MGDMTVDELKGKTGCRKAQQKQAWKTGRYTGIQYSLSTDKKDSGTKKSYMG